VGSKVAGRVDGLPRPLPAGLIHVNLGPPFGADDPASSTVFAVADVAENGAFAFQDVLPGSYRLMVVGGVTALSPARGVTVFRGEDIENIAITARPFISGKVVVEGGGPLPADVYAAAGDPDAAAQARVGALFDDNSGNSVTVRADGAFVIASPGTASFDRFIRFSHLPIGYEVKSISFGAVDLLKEPFQRGNRNRLDRPNPAASAASPDEIQIVLTPLFGPGQPRSFTVSGRIAGGVASTSGGRLPVTLSPAPAGPRGTLRSTQVLPLDDGTFVFRNVPPGDYAVRLPQGAGVAVGVSDRDISGIQAPAPSNERSANEARIVDAAVNTNTRLQGKTLEMHIAEAAGPNPVDCGRFVRMIRGVDDVLECVRQAITQHKGFSVVTVSNGIDSTDAEGFVAGAAGAISHFKSCTGMCSNNVIFAPCPPPSTLSAQRGGLSCKPPSGAVIRWPAPKTP
jgi:hypothetical protein